MQPYLSLITLAVEDRTAARAFYVDGLGWTAEVDEADVILIRLGPGLLLSLWERSGFVAEVGEPARGPAPMMLSHNVGSETEVDAVLADAERAGATVQPASRREWGGYSGYFTDPFGFRWEVAHLPGPLGEELVAAGRAWAERSTDPAPAPSTGQPPSPDPAGLRILPADLTDPALVALVAEHVTEMAGVSSPEAKHALDLAGLADPSLTLWVVQGEEGLLGCGGLKQLSATAAEIKSMRTVAAARGRGVASRLLSHLLAEAEVRGCRSVHLETGSHEHFAPARRLYARHGFVDSGTFAGYPDDPTSHFMVRTR